jgi:hypothetical protein
VRGRRQNGGERSVIAGLTRNFLGFRENVGKNLNFNIFLFWY